MNKPESSLPLDLKDVFVHAKGKGRSTVTTRPWGPLRTVLKGGSLWPLVIYLSFFLNGPVLWRRFTSVYADAPLQPMLLGITGELTLLLAFNYLLVALFSLFGRHVYRITALFLVLASAACAYYMTLFKVVIGYGVVQALFTTDHDLSVEVVGLTFFAWWLAFGLVPAIALYLMDAPPGLWQQLRQPLRLFGRISLLMLALVLGYGAKKTLDYVGPRLHPEVAGAPVKIAGLVAHSYVPSNWIAGTGAVAANAWQANFNARKLKDPAQAFNYLPATSLDDVAVVFVIGETARYDHFGLLGYDRDTSPHLAAEPNVVGFAGLSCDTATKLSLACMFVRPEGIQPSKDLGPDTILEDSVFSVYRKLGFSIDLFAMQSEAGFYTRTGADFYKIREVIAAQPENAGRPIDDAMLVPEVAASLEKHEARNTPHPHLVILHTKGSHYLYTQRYPRSFARWQPECPDVDSDCTQAQFLNSFDNSILYTDYVLGQIIDQLRTRKALLVYSSDHGESIDDNMHFHATPKKIAPPEQRRVPLVFWASDSFLADPILKAGFSQLRQKSISARQEQYGHHNLFASLLGCLGIRSDNGGITATDNLCAQP